MLFDAEYFRSEDMKMPRACAFRPYRNLELEGIKKLHRYRAPTFEVSNRNYIEIDRCTGQIGTGSLIHLKPSR